MPPSGLVCLLRRLGVSSLRQRKIGGGDEGLRIEARKFPRSFREVFGKFKESSRKEEGVSIARVVDPPLSITFLIWKVDPRDGWCEGF